MTVETPPPIFKLNTLRVVLLLVGVVAITVVLSVWAASMVIVPSVDAAYVARMEQQISLQESEVVALKALVKKQADDLVMLDEVVAKKSDTQNQIIALEEKINHMPAGEGKDRELIMKLLAFERLRDRMNQGQAYGKELRELQELLDSRGAALLKPLEAPAMQGIPTLAALQHDFTTDVQAALRAQLAEKAATGLWGKTKANLSHFITIRKVGAEQPGKTDEAIIARAEAALQDGLVASALVETGSLSEVTAPAFAEWRKRANAYETMQRQLPLLRDAILTTVAVP